MRKMIDNLKTRYGRLISIILSALLFRLAIYVIFYVVMVVFGDYSAGLSFDVYLAGWKRWDSGHYIDIAAKGYTNCIEDGQHLMLVFLPLYPFFIRILNVVIGNYELAGLIVSITGYVIGCVYFYLTMSKEYDDETAKYSVIALSVFPYGFFLGGIVTEGLFFSLSAGFLYYLQKDKYFVVAIFGFLACLCKLQGGFLAFVILAYLLKKGNIVELMKSKDFKGVIKKIIIPGLKTVPMLLGIVVYLFINYSVEKDPFKFLYYQETHWNHKLGPIWNTFIYSLKNFLDNKYNQAGYVLWLPQVALMILGLVAVWYGIKHGMKLHHMVYLIVFYLVTFSSTWLISGGRYSLSILPLFIAEGIFLKNHPQARYFVLGLSLSLMTVYMVAYFKGMYVI